jgi:hypothetical protein
MFTLLGLFGRSSTSEKTWREVTFSEGCSLYFPGKPKGKLTEAITALGPIRVTTYNVKDPLTGVSLILAVRHFARNDSHTAKEHFDAWQEEFVANMPLTGVDHTIKHVESLPGPLPTRQFLFTNPEESVFTRVLLTYHRQRLFILFAVGQARSMARSEVTECFHSFWIK